MNYNPYSFYENFCTGGDFRKYRAFCRMPKNKHFNHLTKAPFGRAEVSFYDENDRLMFTGEGNYISWFDFVCDMAEKFNLDLGTVRFSVTRKPSHKYRVIVQPWHVENLPKVGFCRFGLREVVTQSGLREDGSIWEVKDFIPTKY